MEIVYASEKLKTTCTSNRAALKFFGGNSKLAMGLQAKIQALKAAQTIRDIIYTPSLHFHKLRDKGRKGWEGYFAIDVAGRREPWRLILQPLDNDHEPFVPCNIDEICDIVQVVKVEQVSKHYE